MDLTEKTFDFACYARSAFASGDMQTKKSIFMALGENYTLKDKKVFISANECLKAIERKYPVIEKEYKRLELENKLTQKEQNTPYEVLRPLLRGRPDLNRQSPP